MTAKFVSKNYYNNTVQKSYLSICNSDFLLNENIIEDKSILSQVSHYCLNLNDYYLGTSKYIANLKEIMCI
jgi:hypothetical protein